MAQNNGQNFPIASTPVQSTYQSLYKLSLIPNLKQLRTIEYVCENPDLFVANQSQIVSICSYNVLSEKTRLKNSKVDSKQQMNDWEKRWPRIVEELFYLRADVFCLQEVEKENFEDFFKPLFEAGNYEFYFTPRSNKDTDGCVLAFDTSKFSCHSFEDFTYNHGVSGFNRNNIGQMISLHTKSGEQMFVVANTQICQDALDYNTKIGQNILLHAHIDKFITKPAMFKNYCGVIMCGNFGFEPFSPLYNFLCNGKIDFKQFDIKQVAKASDNDSKWLIPYKVPAEVKLNLNNCTFLERPNQHQSKVTKLSHARRYLSAYPHLTPELKPEVTTYTADGQHSCQDYIFYTGGYSENQSVEIVEIKIFLLAILVLPSFAKLDNACGPMPNAQAGSDHLPLYAKFMLS